MQVSNNIIHQVRLGTFSSLVARCGLRRAILLGITVLAVPTISMAQVPSVVGTSQSALTTTAGIYSGQTAVDACGDVFVNPSSGSIVEILAGTGVVKTISTNTNGYNNGPAIAIDPAKANLYYTTSAQWYSSQYTKVPITKCTLGTATTVSPAAGCPTNQYYFGNAQFIAPDTLGDVFYVPSACNTGIYEQLASGKVVTVLTTWPNGITSLAVDLAGNAYFTDGSANVYQVKPAFPGTGLAFGSGFTKPTGITVDIQGNLMISDSSTLYEIPNGSTGLVAANRFAYAAVTLTNAVSADLAGNYYSSNSSGPLAIRSSISFANTAVATSASATMSYIFNSAVTPAAITAKTGTATSTVFSVGTAGTCKTGTAYIVGQSCTVNLTYTPTLAGQQRAAVVMSNAVGLPLNEFSLRGNGLASAVTVDPGTLTQLGSGFSAPNGIATGPDGSVYVTDSAANAVTMFVAGSTVGTALSTGALTLSSPDGVAVDNAGNVYIVDTGNNRVVEVPVVNGVLTPASSIAYTAAMKAPTGIAIGGSGNLYIADTGNKRLLFVQNLEGTPNFATAQAYGTGFNAPSSVTLDLNGNVFVGDSGNNNVYEFTAPLGSAPQAAVVTGLSAPTSVATDASGSLYVVDSGSANVYLYPNNAGVFGARNIVSNGILNPAGVALDTTGNLYVTDTTNKVVDKLLRSQGSLAFGVENVGTPSAKLTATVNSSGTQPLTLSSPSYTVSGNTAAGFVVTADGCSSAGTVATGGSCAITAQFTPPAIAPLATETLTLRSNAAVSGETILLSGTGRVVVVPSLTIALTSPAANQGLQANQAVTFTVTISTGMGTATPGGTIKLYVNGNQVSVTPVTSTSVQISLPNGLPDGNVTINAVYSGDQLNYSGASGTLVLVVAALPTSLTLTVSASTTGAPLYTNPLSINDYAGNGSGPALTLTANLTTSGVVIPGGNVSFYYGSSTSPTLLGISSVLVTSTGYQASIPVAFLRAGTSNVVENNAFLTTYNLFAVYSGDTTYNVSTTPTVPLSLAGATGDCTSYVDGCTGYTPSTVTTTPPTPPTFCALGSSTTCYPSPKDGASFSVLPASSTITITSSTVAGQGTGSINLNVTSYGGWTGILTFTCAGLPIYAKCAPYPGAPQINATTSGPALATNQIQFSILTNVQPPDSTAAALPWEVAGLMGLMLLLARRRFALLRRSGFALLGLMVLLVGGMMSVQGCGSGTTTDFTPAGTSTITVYVKAAQLNTVTATTYSPNDLNTPSFQLQLVVK